MGWVDLKREPHDSPHRAIALGGRAQYRWDGAKPNAPWRTVEKNWRIANCCFNDLGDAWTAHSGWRIRDA